MQFTILLFDIDGTLITTAGAGRRALTRAFETLHGRPDALTGVQLDGMTDYAIIREVLTRLQLPFTPATLEAVLARYVEFLEDEVARSQPEKYIVHPGVREALEKAASTARVAIGLGTGNVQRGAHIKLARVGLSGHFAFGGFGSDAESRPELIRHGAIRGAAALGQPLEACRVVVIGDTPRDVAAAHAIGAECIAVATGSYSMEALREAGAEHVFAHLGEPGALAALLPDALATSLGDAQ